MGKALKYFNGDVLASSVWKQKYALDGESSPEDMFNRIAKEFSRVDSNYTSYHENLSEYGKIRYPHYFDRVLELINRFENIVLGGSVMAGAGSNKAVSLSNCFTTGEMEDNVEDIFSKITECAELYKRRGGASFDLSKLRPRGAIVHNSASTSTGPIPFMQIGSVTGQVIGSDGRRAACLVSFDVRHPDILEFIKAKSDQTKINDANISVKFNDDFFNALKQNEDFILKFPCDYNLSTEEKECFIKNNPYDILIEIKTGVYLKKIKSSTIWNEFTKQNWQAAEPGFLNWDRAINYDPSSVYPKFKGVSTNACSEQILDRLNSCRLSALNVFSLVVSPFTKDSFVDYTKAYKMFYEQIVMLDNLVDLEIEHTNTILNKISDSTTKEYKMWEIIKEKGIESRRCGAGVTGLADFIAGLGLRYGSNECKEVTDKLFKIKMKAELDATIDLSILRGSFPAYNHNLEYDETDKGKNDFYQFLHTEFPEQFERMKKYGRRHISWSTLAPVGTGSLMTQTTSGMEPVFKPYYIRKRKSNNNETPEYLDEQGIGWITYNIIHSKLKDWILINFTDITDVELISKKSLNELYEQSPYYNSSAEDIDYHARIEMQSIIQKYTTASISSTVNLHKDVSMETISEIYKEAWKLGLKGITVYRDTSRAGVLVSENTNNNEIKDNHAPKRPKNLQAHLYPVTVKGHKFGVVVGLLNSRPYEVFAFVDVEGTTKNCIGELVKEKKGVYNFSTEDFVINNIHLAGESERAVTILASQLLRHGVPINHITSTIKKISNGITDFTTAVARVLTKYTKNGEETGDVCPECGTKLTFENGCKICKSCGYSGCS